MKLIRILSGGIIAASCLLSVSAASLTPAEALKRVSGNSRKMMSLSAGIPTLNKKIKIDGVPALYLFDSDTGYMVVSADDRAPALLGWSEQAFDEDDLPPGFEAWMNGIARQIAAIGAGEVSGNYVSTRSTTFEAVSPLCKTKWNQGEPYNNKCPKNYKDDKRSVTGCVATAMAQVMKYHNWPESGEGEVAYKCSVSSFPLKLDFSYQVYDWDNMLDTYIEGEYTEVEADAVAILMKSCGYAVEMDYSSSSSGATSVMIGQAFGKYFKYDKSKLRYVMRDYFSLEEWEEMVYISLVTYGPVILDGQSNQGGHCFVCDGYDGNGYFHINWGWGGVSDGYFLLSVLDPFDQGIGGSGDNSGFNYMQDAVLGITPAKDSEGKDSANGEETWIGTLYSAGDLGIDIDREYQKGETVEGICPDGVFNYGPTVIPSSALFGLIFRSEGSEDVYGSIGQMGAEIGLYYGFKDLEIPMPEEIPDGEYLMTLSYAYYSEEAEEMPDEDVKWLDVYFPEGCEGFYNATVEGDTIRFSPSDWRPSGVEPIPASVSVRERYFNLQGVELPTPPSGEIVIVVKDGKVSKKIY